MPSNTSNSSQDKPARKIVRRVIKSSRLDASITLDDAFDEFIAEKVYQNKAEKTIKNYKQTYRYFKEYHELDETFLAKEVDKEMVYDFVNEKAGEVSSEASVNHYLRDIRTFLYWCMDDTREYITPFKIKERKIQELQPKTIPAEEIVKLLEKPQHKGDADFVEWRSYAIIAWILATGNRARTVSEIRIGDIDFAAKEITLKQTKSKKALSIPFSSQNRATIKEYMRLYRNGAKATDYLFCNQGGEKLTYNAMRLAHTRYCEKRNVPDRSLDEEEKKKLSYYRSLHALRHTFAKNFYKRNKDVFKLQEILGHSSIAITKRYVKLVIDDLKEDYDSYSMLDNIKQKGSRRRTITSSDK